ncbi:MAG: hypothetical protein IPM16_23475 [Chloroflexi bacterium]|nr:hypothetical protein [Chloroflexota bacterium]
MVVKPPYSAEELARILKQDQELGRNIVRTRAMAEAQTLNIPPRAERTPGWWVRFAFPFDGYNIAYEVHGEDLNTWVNRAVYRGRHTFSPDDLRDFPILDLRLMLFHLQRSDYFSGGDPDTYDPIANDLLDILREKLETDS